MKTFSLITQKGIFSIDERLKQRSSIPPDGDVLIGPSLTFRKNFEIPESVEQNPRKLKLKIFSRFLPEDIDEFTCQFITGTVPSGNQRKVSGFGIHNDRLASLKNHLSENQDIFFLEALLKNPFPEERTKLTLFLPGGRLLARFENDFVIWTNFRQDDGDNHVHVPQFLPDFDREYSTVNFPENPDNLHATDWVEGFRKCLDPDPPGNLSLVSRSIKSVWEQWRPKVYGTVLFMALTLLGWIGVMYYSNAVRHNWMRTEYQNLTGESSRTPFSELRTKITRLEKTVATSRDRPVTPPLYSVIPQIDSVFSNNDIKLLTLGLSRNTLEVTFLSSSLETAEEFRNELGALSTIKNPSIVNSNTLSGEDYSYEIDLTGKLSLQ